MNPQISIIVPVYNVQDYLEKCLDSILNQTLTDFEVILVDDGSKDNSSIICDQYVRKDSRIKVIHQDNNGVSHARNRGLDLATGDYIGFVDPDDYIDERMYEFLVHKIEEVGADLAICSFLVATKDEVIAYNNGAEYQFFNQEQAIQYYFNERLPFDYSFLCNKLFHKKLFKEIRLNPKLSVQEDSEVLIRILDLCSSIVYIPDSLYVYYVRADSATRSKLTLKQLTGADSLYEVYKYTKHSLPKYSKYALNKYLLYYFNLVIELVKNEKDFNKEYFIFRKKLNNSYFSILFNTTIPFKYKVHSTMYLFVPKIYKYYLKKRLFEKG